MSKIMIIALLAVTAAAVMAAPAEEYDQLEFEVQPSEDGEHLRFRRVTCDLLSVKGVIGDSACAANCLTLGKAGGHCNNGVCQCRKTSFGDLWNQRFGH